MHPYYVARAVGGLLFLNGAIIGAYNIWMTVRTGVQEWHGSTTDMPSPVLPGVTAHGSGE